MLQQVQTTLTHTNKLIIKVLKNTNTTLENNKQNFYKT